MGKIVRRVMDAHGLNKAASREEADGSKNAARRIRGAGKPFGAGNLLVAYRGRKLLPLTSAGFRPAAGVLLALAAAGKHLAESSFRSALSTRELAVLTRSKSSGPALPDLGSAERTNCLVKTCHRPRSLRNSHFAQSSAVGSNLCAVYYIL